MKKTIQRSISATFLFSALLAVIFTGCTKEDIAETANVLFKADMKAAISKDGEQEDWTAHLRRSEIIPGTDKLNFTGLSVNGKLINITTWRIAKRTYTGKILSQGDSTSFFTAFYAEDLEDSTETLTSAFKDNAYALPEGKVEITDINTLERRVSGTFSFTLYKNQKADSVMISKGTFTDLKY